MSELDRLCERIAQAQDDIPEPDVNNDGFQWDRRWDFAHLDGLLLAMTTLLGWPEPESTPDDRALRYMQDWRTNRERDR